MKVVMALVALAAVATPVAAQTVTAGDTINLNGTTYRLWGIEAPESRQWCGEYPAGLISTAMLEIHKDPFDRMLIAQAHVEGVILATSDEVVARYPGQIRRL